MPPKKRDKKKKSKKDEFVPSVDDKYQQTLQQIRSLKDHLGLQTDLSRRSLSSAMQMREKVQEASDTLELEQKSKLDISADLARQYKTMQVELSAKIHVLEQAVDHQQQNLAQLQSELSAEREDKMRIVQEKDDIISELKYKIEHMESAYENVLHDTMDLFGDVISEAKVRWQAQAHQILLKNKERLLEFGLNPLDL